MTSDVLCLVGSITTMTLISCVIALMRRGRLKSSLLLIPVFTPCVIMLMRHTLKSSVIFDHVGPVGLRVVRSSQDQAAILSSTYWVELTSLISAVIVLILMIKSSEGSRLSSPHRDHPVQSRAFRWLMNTSLFALPVTYLISWWPHLDDPQSMIKVQVIGISVVSALTCFWISRTARSDRADEALTVALVWFGVIASVSFSRLSWEQAQLFEWLAEYPHELITSQQRLFDVSPWVFMPLLIHGVINCVIVCASHFMARDRTQTERRRLGAFLMGLSCALATLVLSSDQLLSRHREGVEDIWAQAAPLKRAHVQLATSSSPLSHMPATTLLINAKSQWLDGRRLRPHHHANALKVRLVETKATYQEVIESMVHDARDDSDDDIELTESVQREELSRHTSTMVIAAHHETPYETVFSSMTMAKRQGYQSFLLMVRSPDGERRFIPAFLTGRQLVDDEAKNIPRDPQAADQLRDEVTHAQLISPDLHVKITAQGYEVSIEYWKTSGMSPPREAHPDQYRQMIPCRGKCSDPNAWDHRSLKRTLTEIKQRYPRQSVIGLRASGELKWSEVIETLNTCREILDQTDEAPKAHFKVALDLHQPDRGEFRSYVDAPAGSELPKLP